MAKKIIGVKEENYKAVQLYLFGLGYRWKDTGRNINRYNTPTLHLDETNMIITCSSHYDKPDIIFEEIINSQNYELWI